MICFTFNLSFSLTINNAQKMDVLPRVNKTFNLLISTHNLVTIWCAFCGKVQRMFTHCKETGAGNEK